MKYPTEIPIPAPDQIDECDYEKWCTLSWLCVAFDGVTKRSKLNTRIVYNAACGSPKARFAQELAKLYKLAPLRESVPGSLSLWPIAFASDKATPAVRATNFEKAAIACGYEIVSAR